MKVPRYSICIVNLNMQETIEVAMRSVLSQLDDEFEVVLVDDGSTDQSLDILERLCLEFPFLKIFRLKRDKKRELSETRNYSVSKAVGDYVILHIDCDDFWYPHIKDFILVYHEIERELGPKFLMSGFQFHMGEINFLRSMGPYQRGHWGEDRDMWHRMAKIESWVPIDHVVFRTRMPLTRKKRFYKKFILPIRVVRDEIYNGNSFSTYLSSFTDKTLNHSFKFRLYKCIIYPIAWMQAKVSSREKHGSNLDKTEWNNLKRTAWEKSGTVEDFFAKLGKKFDFSILSPIGQVIFSNKSSDLKIEDLYNER